MQLRDCRVVIDAVYGRLNVNVALNRPSFMSSVHFDPMYGGEFGAWKANDGDRDPVAMQFPNSCINTAENQSDPWWAVDLGTALSVLGVLFANRAESYGNVYVMYYMHVCRQNSKQLLVHWELSNSV